MLECAVVNFSRREAGQRLTDRFGSGDVLALGDGVHRSELFGCEAYRYNLHRLGATAWAPRPRPFISSTS